LWIPDWCIGYGQNAEQRLRIADEHGSVAGVFDLLQLGMNGRITDIQLFEQGMIPEDYLAVVDPGSQAFSGQGLESLHRLQRNSLVLRRLQNCLGEGVLGTALGRGCQGQDLRLGVAVVADDPHQLGAALGHGTGLVHGQGLELAEGLQIGPALDENAVARRIGQPADDGHGG
jgi:hypothetical protein